ncbi:unnamed protein product [Meloidogyne enterolobii]|uniref:Uncharacterized protein n=1 Tax=Meloidogyne enterolobii TaxID=390850 RepID=A0ACB1AG07_MELEN
MSKALLLDDTFDEKDDEIGIRFNERLSLQPATSTPSLSESYGSATLLCRPDKQENQSQQRRKIDVFANIKKTAEDSLDDKSCVDYSPCTTINYDTFLNESTESKGINNELIKNQSENEHFILNPVFCDTDIEIEENIEKRNEEKIALLKNENIILNEEDFGNIALSSTNLRKSLISTKQRKGAEVAFEEGTQTKKGKKVGLKYLEYTYLFNKMPSVVY